MKQRTYIGFSRDHSGSMRHIAQYAARDYNSMLSTIQAAATANNQDTIVSVVTIGVGSSPTVGREIVNSNVHVLNPIPQGGYRADASGTPLFASVFELIKIMKAVPDYNNPDVSFLLMVTTDGQETEDRYRGTELAREIRELQNTDRWTVVFRVPNDGTSKRELMKLGISEGNIFEWGQTERGVQVASTATTEAFTQYFSGRASGMKSTTRFYANMADVDIKEVKKALVDVSTEVQFWPVSQADDQTLIRPFVEGKLNSPMMRGAAFYQLVKLEPRVQANKRIAIRDKNTGAVFAGDAARQMLALPTVGTVRLAPDDMGQFEVYIQSTSVNRKLDAGTSLLYWPGVGKAFQEGPSAS
jgi:hypothetical protein